jgi:hypothetical protein
MQIFWETGDEGGELDNIGRKVRKGVVFDFENCGKMYISF